MGRYGSRAGPGDGQGLQIHTWPASSLDFASAAFSESGPVARPCSTSPASIRPGSLPAEWISSSSEGSNGIRREFESSYSQGPSLTERMRYIMAQLCRCSPYLCIVRFHPEARAKRVYLIPRVQQSSPRSTLGLLSVTIRLIAAAYTSEPETKPCPVAYSRLSHSCIVHGTPLIPAT
jgi:hypothetical protein